MASSLPREQRAALSMAAAWMGKRFFRTFRPVEVDPEPFDALLQQRERRVGVTLAPLWDDGEAIPGADELERLVSADLEAAGDASGCVLWVPGGAALPEDEPQRSDFRLLIERGVRGLSPAQRREVRVPAILRLAKVEADGAYVSVSGGLAPYWTHISEGVSGSFHLDSRAIHRTPEEEAEREIVLSRVRDRAVLLEPKEVTEVHTHDYWLVSRLPTDEPRGFTVVAATPGFDAADGATVRRLFRRAVRRAVEQRSAGDADLGVLVLLAPIPHVEDEMATAALRGMSPAAYSTIDLILLVADGQVREVLQPRRLPWEA